MDSEERRMQSVIWEASRRAMREYCDIRDDIIMQEAGPLIVPVEPDRCRRCGRIPTPYRPVRSKRE